MWHFFKNLIKTTLLVVFPILFSAPALAEDVHIALRAHKGADKALEQWQATADHLSDKIPGYNFILVPFEINSSLSQAVSRGEYHFTLTNPAASVEHKIRYGAQPLATLVNKRQGKGYSKFGSVIFTRSDRKDINVLKDLKRKNFIGADEQGFGGWRVAWFELLKNDINPYRDFKTLNFAGGKQQRVVYSVRDGKSDAGSVRTDMLERMAAAGKIDLTDYKVLSQKKNENFPFMHSTELYPEWLFSATKILDDNLKTQVVKTLFSIKSSDLAAKNGKYVRWISPLDYLPVDKLLRELKVGPYQVAAIGTLKWIIREYSEILIISFLIFIFLVISFIYLVRQNQRIVLSQDMLLSEERKRETLELQLVQSQKIESLGQLTGGIAHDFNNMLASILGFTELALNSKSAQEDDTISRYLNNVMASGESAKLLVNQMLAFSRTDGDVEKNEIFLVDSLIKNIYELLHPLLPSSINLKVNNNESNLYINANRTMLEQVLMNVCLNSKDAFDLNKGSIVISTEAVVIDNMLCDSCQQNISGSFVSIKIEDDGCGISKEVQQRLFDPFFSTKEVGKGTGMGLAMVHGIIHKHDGHILVDSILGKGACFKILLPLKSKAGSYEIKKQDTLDSIKLNKTKSELAGKHILIVDDEIYITNYLRDLLTTYGYKVTLYNDSNEALSYFKTHSDEIDLVITDQTMPKLTGEELVVKMFEVSRDIPIILCTGYSESMNQEKALAMNINAFLDKPIQSNELLNIVSSLLKNEV